MSGPTDSHQPETTFRFNRHRSHLASTMFAYLGLLKSRVSPKEVIRGLRGIESRPLQYHPTMAKTSTSQSFYILPTLQECEQSLETVSVGRVEHYSLASKRNVCRLSRCICKQSRLRREDAGLRTTNHVSHLTPATNHLNTRLFISLPRG